MALFISTNQEHPTEAIIIDVFQAGIDSHPDWFENEVKGGKFELHHNNQNLYYCSEVGPHNNGFSYVFKVPREHYICILKSNTSGFHKIKFDQVFSVSPGILQANFKPYNGELDSYLSRIKMRFDAGTTRPNATIMNFQECLDNNENLKNEFETRISSLGLEYEATGNQVVLILDGEVIKDDLFGETELDIFLQGCELGIKLKTQVYAT